MEEVYAYLDQLIVLLRDYELFRVVRNFGLRVLAALAVFVVGRWAIRIATRMFREQLLKRNFDETLVTFGANLLTATLLSVVVLSSLNTLGIPTTSMVAILGAAGLAVGLALQGSLSNFAAGVILIGVRPFKVGDYVEVGGVGGTVEDINMLYTRLCTPDNKSIYVPNNSITGDRMVNYSAKEKRRVDLVFGIGYEDDIPKAKAVLSDILKADERVLEDPAPLVGVLNHGDSSIDIACRPWVKRIDYWPFYWDVMERVKIRFDEENISIPFPQRDLHIVSGGPPPLQ